MTKNEFDVFKSCLKRGERVVVTRTVMPTAVTWTFKLPSDLLVLSVNGMLPESVYLYNRPQTYLKLFQENGYDSLPQDDPTTMIFEKAL